MNKTPRQVTKDPKRQDMGKKSSETHMKMLKKENKEVISFLPLLLEITLHILSLFLLVTLHLLLLPLQVILHLAQIKISTFMWLLLW